MRVGVILTVVITAASLAGCSGPEAKFVLAKDTESLMKEARKPIEKVVTEHFGTPHKLVGWEKLPIDYGKADKAVPGHETAGWQLVEGRNLYMRHCLHCHGVSGDGNGPTAPYLNPRPRDYRRGEFKFTSTAVGVKARRDDIHLVLQNGIPGTSMPSFALLKANELTALVEYVRWLAMRGEFEKRLVAELSSDYSVKAVNDRRKNNEKLSDIIDAFNKLMTSTKEAPSEFSGTIKDVGDNLAADWLAAEDEANLIVPKHPRHLPSADPQSVSRGRALYMSEKLKCYTCHGLAARGDGTSTVDYWAIPGSSPEKKFEARGLHDNWGNPIKPRNLTLGQYRGGRRPIDLYRRIYAGIKGTQMAGFATALRDAKDEKGNALNDDQVAERMDRHIWDIVNYILAVPYQQQTIEPLLPMTAAATPAPAPAK
ncbi:MAG: cytochrome c [Planctomycetaceae bacterium]|nr:cytochrome c [Planctomycetaceae bacterium]